MNKVKISKLQTSINNSKLSNLKEDESTQYFNDYKTQVINIYWEELDALAQRNKELEEQLKNVNELYHVVCKRNKYLQEYHDDVENKIKTAKKEVLEVYKENNKIKNALKNACYLLEIIEKDNCTYCPLEKGVCVDREQYGTGHCKADKWEEFLKNE